MKQETFTDIEYSYRKKKTKREEFLEIMGQTMQERHYSLMLLMLTDVLLEGTQLIYLATRRRSSRPSPARPRTTSCFCRASCPRKKQIIPTLSAMWG